MAYECPCLKKNRPQQPAPAQQAPASPCGSGYTYDPKTGQCIPVPKT